MSRGGLAATETICNYHCTLIDSELFVFIGSTPARFVNSIAILNLANFAESLGAKALVLISDKTHTEWILLRKLFRIIDAEQSSVEQSLALNEHLFKINFIPHNNMEFFRMVI